MSQRDALALAAGPRNHDFKRRPNAATATARARHYARALPPRSRPSTMGDKMERAVRAIERARDELAAQDKERKTTLATDLDLATIVKRAEAKSFASPEDVLAAVAVTWRESHVTAQAAVNAANKRAATTALEGVADLADAVVLIQRIWLDEGLFGCPLNDDDYQMHAAEMDHRKVKTALASMERWTQRNFWDGFLPVVKDVKEEVAKKRDGKYRTYAQVLDALDRIQTDAAEALRAKVKGGMSRAKKEQEAQDAEDAEDYLKAMKKWLREKWHTENGLPLPSPTAAAAGDGDAGGSPGAGPKRRGSVGGRSAGKRKRYAEDDSDADFSMGSDDESNSDSEDGDDDDDSDASEAADEPQPKKRRGRPPGSKTGSAAAKAAAAAAAAKAAASVPSYGGGGGAWASSQPPAAPTGAVPPGAVVSAFHGERAVLVKIKCHGLQATALLRVPKGSSGQSGAAVKAAAPSPRAQIHAPTPRSPPPGKPAFVPVTASPHAPTPYVQGVGERCARNDGKMWRCKMTAIEGASFCAHHRQKGNASPSPAQSPSPAPRPPQTRAEVAAKGVGSDAGPGVASKAPAATAGDPVTIRILAVAGAPTDGDPASALASPAAFEKHAFGIAREVEREGGAVATRAAPPPGDPDAADDATGDAYFRANAVVYEREHVWTPFPAYERKLLGTTDASFAEGVGKPQAQNAFSSASAEAQRSKDRAAQHADAFERHRDAARGDGVGRARAIREQLKRCAEYVDDVDRDVRLLRDDCENYGREGFEIRKNSQTAAAMMAGGAGGSDYVEYTEKIDRAIILTAKWA